MFDCSLWMSPIMSSIGRSAWHGGGADWAYIATLMTETAIARHDCTRPFYRYPHTCQKQASCLIESSGYSTRIDHTIARLQTTGQAATRSQSLLPHRAAKMEHAMAPTRTADRAKTWKAGKSLNPLKTGIAATENPIARRPRLLLPSPLSIPGIIIHSSVTVP